MPTKIKPTGRQKSILALHMVIFAIGVTIMWMTYDKGVRGWAYPWPAWITAGWGLGLLGHICVTFTSYDDKGWNQYRHEQGKEI